MTPGISLAFISTPGAGEWLLILLIGLLLFGRRLPEVMRSLGGSVRHFREGLDGTPSSPPPTVGIRARTEPTADHPVTTTTSPEHPPP